jgi:hypothetical protein
MTDKEAIKLALEALKTAQNNLAPSKHSAHSFGDGELWDMYADAIKALEEALAKQKQRNDSEHSGEPVGFYDAENKDLRREIPMGEDGDWWQPVYTKPQPKREPLTDEQKLAIERRWNGSVFQLIEEIEAAHGITASEAEDSAKE